MEHLQSPSWESELLQDKLGIAGMSPLMLQSFVGNYSSPAFSIVRSLQNWLGCDGKEGLGPISSIHGDFTPCTIAGVIPLVVAILSLVAGLTQMYSYWHTKPVANRMGWQFFAKLLLAVLQIVFTTVSIGAYKGSGIIHSALFATMVSNVVALGLHYLEQYKASISSGVLIFYWFFQTLIGVFKFWNLSLRGSVSSSFGILTVFSLLNGFFLLVLEINFPMITVQRTIANTAPADRANVFSRITFRWLDPLMRKGYNQYLTDKDVPPLPNDLRSKNTYFNLKLHWDNQVKKSVAGSLALSFGAEYLLGGCFKASQDILANVQPHLLRYLIDYVNRYVESKKLGEPISLSGGLFIAVGMFFVSVTQTACLHQYFQRAFDTGIRVRSSLTTKVYRKSLVLSNSARQDLNTGDIVNLMSVDVQRILDLLQNLQLIWSGPFQIFMCLYSLYGLLGEAVWLGFGVMVIMVPLNASIAKYQKKLQKTQMKFKDERSNLINEILNNIKSLKLYAWEQPYLKKLNHVRNDKELANLKRMGIFNALTNFTLLSAPALVSCSTFGYYVLVLKRPLTADIVFPALALFNLLNFPLALLPMVITNIVESQVAFDRLWNFFTAEELQPDAVIKKGKTSDGKVAASIKDGTFLWTKPKSDSSVKRALSKVNFEARKGHLDCIVGRVGCGKTAMLKAFLGDLYKLEGEVTLSGSVAYVSQSAWIMNGTVKDNILFGHKYNKVFYIKVLQACALVDDLAILPDGDMTEVGEKGISLSGGQKARLSLARAVYARADVYLLDDVLSAVDEHVRAHLVDNVLGANGLLKSKCRILCTNSISVLSQAYNLTMVSDGRVIEQNSYDNIMQDPNSQLRKLILEYGSKQSSANVSKQDDVEEKKVNERYGSKLNDKLDAKLAAQEDKSKQLQAEEIEQEINDNDLMSLDDEINADDDEEEPEETEQSKSRKEEIRQGKVKWDVYLSYAKACHLSGVLLFVFMSMSSMFVNIGSNFWLKIWSDHSSKLEDDQNVIFYLGIYFAFGISYAVALMFQSIVMWIFCSINASIKMHKDMAESVLRAPMSFFETTPIGRVLNRFSSDVAKLDEVIGRVFSMFISNCIRVSLTLLVIMSTTWPIIFLLGPLVILYLYYQRYYLKTSRELKRLESVTRSPIFANFQESLSGVSVIRAFGQQDRFITLNGSKVDKNTSANHPSMTANRWLAVRLEFLGSIIILGASGLSIFLLPQGHISAGLIGISVSYALQITQSLNWIVRMSVDVENNIVSVERILEYSQLTPEAPDVIEDNRPPTLWPLSGNIEIKNYSTRYRPELDLVLKDINLSIKAKEKIGIVGRTGAGKSSVTLALFRIIEKVAGDITIDDIETSTIGLADLRHKLSIIPQDSQVFQGTLRSNLDPFEVYTDEQIWKALEFSHLKDHVEKMHVSQSEDSEIENPLDVVISEGGSNLSSGQKQLMCLARVLLKLDNSSILVLDEATAAVDVETDEILQKTIRSEFKEMTILTIAHRLNTIMDSDKIVVLEQGQVKEFDSPANLLKKKDSLFYLLCKQGGFIEE